MPLWATAGIAVLCIGIGAAVAADDTTDEAASSDTADLERQLDEKQSELDEREERIDELTDEVDDLERELGRATDAPTTTDATPTTVVEPPLAAPPVTELPATAETVSQRNAREKAADYLAFSAFSRSGLIDQLMFEGFSQADASYGVDALNVNWNEQAAKKAADYLEFSSFSRSGLIDQLIFEGFTPAEAEYGVSTTGL